MNSSTILSVLSEYQRRESKEVDLSNKDLTEIPDELFSMLPNIETLFLQGNQIRNFEKLSTLLSLKKLNIDDNPTYNLSFLDTLVGMESFSFRKKKEENYPSQQISQAKNMNYLQQQSTEGVSPPIDFTPLEKLTMLKELFIDNQSIQSEDCFRKVKTLTALSLNGIYFYPYNITHLSDLEYLSISSANISDLGFITAFPRLKTLIATGNYLSEIQLLTSVPLLEVVGLGNNQIEDLSPLSALTELRLVDISHNSAKDLTPLTFMIVGKKTPTINEKIEFPSFVNMIGLAGNKWETPPLEVVLTGGDTLRNYLIEYFEKEQVINREIKLILVGNSTSGKSSLSRLLRTGRFDTQETTTHGIQLATWTPEETQLKVQVWDFGGQEYYHATHRLFLSNRAVYAVLWDRGTQEGGFTDTEIFYQTENGVVKKTESLEHFPLAYWLDTIRFYASESSIFTIQNKIDHYIPAPFPSGLREGYEINPEHIFSMSVKLASEGMGLNEEDKWKNKYLLKHRLFEAYLKEELLRSANSFSISKYWKQVRTEIETLAKTQTIISLHEFTDICLKYEANPNPELVIFYLEEMAGLILYFKENEVLHDKIFLNPNQIHGNIYKILSYKVRENQGLFDLKHVQETLNISEADSQNYVALMIQFELIFEVEKGKYITPQYLPHSLESAQIQMIEQFMHLDSAFVLRLPRFIPRSLISRFISQKGNLAQKNIYWKFGILYKEKNISVLVHAHYRTRTISVSIQNASPKQKMEVLRGVWENLYQLIGSREGWQISADKLAFIPLTNALSVEKIGEDYFVPLEEIQQADKFGAKYLLSKNWETEYFRFLLPPATRKSAQVFIACASGDELEYKEVLEKHLSLLVRKEVIQIWDNEDISPGTDRDKEIEDKLENAGIILLLVSAAFMADEEIWEKILQKVLQKYNNGEAIVIPIYLRPCDTSLWDFGGLEMLPSAKDSDGKPVPISRMDKDEAFLEVTNTLRALIFQKGKTL